MYWLRWHYHVKDTSGAPYRTKQKRKKRRQSAFAGCCVSTICSVVQLSLQSATETSVRVESRTVGGNEFQIEGPEVAKLRDPYRASQLRGIDKSWWAGERRCWRPAVDDTRMPGTTSNAHCYDDCCQQSLWKLSQHIFQSTLVNRYIQTGLY